MIIFAEKSEDILRWAGIGTTQRKMAADALESMGMADMSLDNRQEIMEKQWIQIYRRDAKRTFASNTLVRHQFLLLMGPAGHTGLEIGDDILVAFSDTSLTGIVNKIEPAKRRDDLAGFELVFLRTIPAPVQVP